MKSILCALAVLALPINSLADLNIQLHVTRFVVSSQTVDQCVQNDISGDECTYDYTYQLWDKTDRLLGTFVDSGVTYLELADNSRFYIPKQKSERFVDLVEQCINTSNEAIIELDPDHNKIFSVDCSFWGN